MTPGPRTVVLTGATGALGGALAAELSRRGDRVIMVGRDARSQVPCDLSSLASVRQAASRLRERAPIDVLVHCAGVFVGDRRLTADGHELMVATNHLGPSLLTLLLGTALFRPSASARVVFVAHPFRVPPCLDEPMSGRAFCPMRAFAMSKAMSLGFACELAARWRGAVSVLAAGPRATRSRLLREAPLSLRLALAALARAPESTVGPIVAALSRSPGTGLYVDERGAARLGAKSDAETRRRVWDLSLALSGAHAPQVPAFA